MVETRRMSKKRTRVACNFCEFSTSRPRDVPKKTRVACNFCEFSTSRYGCGSEEDQDNEEGKLRKEVVRLRNMLMKMHGLDDDASYTELQAFKSHLDKVRSIVVDQQKKEAEHENDGTRRGVSRGMKRGVLVPSTTSSSDKKRQEEKVQLHMEREFERRKSESLEREFERRKSESLESKFKRLWLFNERMNGREIDTMTSYEDLCGLERQIFRALEGLSSQITIGLEIIARYKQCPHKQEDESLSLESELKRLRLLTRRMTGKDLDGLTFAEVQLLKSQLEEALVIVKNQEKKVREEEGSCGFIVFNQKMKARDKNKATMKSSGEKQDDAVMHLSQSRWEMEYEKRRAESMQSEFERLWLLKERIRLLPSCLDLSVKSALHRER
ncbi:PREDICTED: golgin subfamily A member 6-like protein 6 [Camelina sativa]|uniref:Golgin subfamily A member 6-like protein 6 n=1 Tax=Camelina sativa TaxID=90675 RepID=A0ABM1R0Z7_CAMSA|nr:PREDICTED: golgin subfamily A member 6-like protein 6 [Camelina sativa]